MIVLNASACSAQCLATMTALEAGQSGRRACWEEGKYLRRLGDRIAVFRDGKLSSPCWQGPSGDESNADDWETF